MATMQAEVSRTFLLEGISWTSYVSLLRETQDQRVRMTYDRGTLEFMTLSLGHEAYGNLIGRLIETFTLELDIEIYPGGSTTFHKKARQRGLEPDESYWIQNAAQMRGKREYDIQNDPPPDLAIEIDISRSSLDRLSIYASLGVPEVWRFDGETLTVHVLKEGVYSVSGQSLALPLLPPSELMRILAESNEENHHELVRSFLAWIRRGFQPPEQNPKRRPRKK